MSTEILTSVSARDSLDAPVCQGHDASFRDPSGFIFRHPNGEILRQVNREYEEDFQLLMASGLYDSLAEQRLLVRHEEIELDLQSSENGARILRPDQIPVISYPYEWSFSQLKDAALLTLEIQKQALNHGMTLKDASAYNVQFLGVNPIFIDTLSFEKYQKGNAWEAYGQFCRHFVAPLALWSCIDYRLTTSLRQFIDGFPLDLAFQLLPIRKKLNPGLLTHLGLHAKSIAKHADTQSKTQSGRRNMSRLALDGILDSLTRTIQRMKWRSGGTEWADYYQSNSYSNSTSQQKAEIVGQFLDEIRPQLVWDLGANTGVFSREAVKRGAYVVAFDIDVSCVEANYLNAKTNSEKNILPLIMDLANPSPGLGWAQRERDSLADRGPADVIMALALIHHLAISNNVPFERIASYFAQLGNNLIIEFVPKSDPQTQRLLQGRKDIFSKYHQEGFEQIFSKFFLIENRKSLTHQDGRILYRMKRL